MWHRSLLLASLSLFFAMGGCYGPDREPGDDPARADEGPDGGRPKTDSAQTKDKPGYGGGRTTDAGSNADDGEGTLDGASDEVTR